MRADVPRIAVRRDIVYSCRNSVLVPVFSGVVVGEVCPSFDAYPRMIFRVKSAISTGISFCRLM